MTTVLADNDVGTTDDVSTSSERKQIGVLAGPQRLRLDESNRLVPFHSADGQLFFSFNVVSAWNGHLMLELFQTPAQPCDFEFWYQEKQLRLRTKNGLTGPIFGFPSGVRLSKVEIKLFEPASTRHPVGTPQSERKELVTV